MDILDVQTSKNPQFMMALLERPMAKTALADDFYTWYSEYKSTWKPQRTDEGVASSARQAIQLSSPKPSSEASQVACGAATTASEKVQVPYTELSAIEKLALLNNSPLASSSDTDPPTSLSISPSSSCSSLTTSSLSPPSPSSSAAAAIFTTDYYEARPSTKGGIGAFAIKEILIDTIILAEEPLMLANIMEVYYAYESLPAEKRKLFRSLYGWQGVNPEPTMAIFKTNRFEIEGKGGIFYKTSRFNHACHPAATCTYRWNPREQKLITTTLRNIKAGEEITISYGSAGSLYENYGFYCDCEYCPRPEQAAKDAERLRGPGDRKKSLWH